MPKLSEVKIKPPKILLYGDVGTGKTAFTLTLGDRLQVLDMDEGTLTGVTLDDKFRSRRLEVDVVSCPDPDPNKATAFGCGKAHVLKVANQAVRKAYPYDAFAIDSLTALADHAVRMVMVNSGMAGKNPQIQHWGLAFNEIENILTVARSIPGVFILIAHAMNIEIDGNTKKEIAIPGKSLPNKIARYFDEIWFAKVQNKAGGKQAFTIQTKSTASIVARSRLNIPDGIDMSLGLEEILKQGGYEFPVREPTKETT